MRNKPTEANHGREAALDELEKLARLLDCDPDVVYAMSEADVRRELQESGLDCDKPRPRVQSADQLNMSVPTARVPSPSSQRSRRRQERECFHRDQGTEGQLYDGEHYVKALTRLPVDAAMKMAAKVGSFFWADASDTAVWLCHHCADELALLDKPALIEQIRDRRA